MKEKSKEIKDSSLVIVGTILLLMLIGCMVWLSCREYCISFFYTNYDSIISSLFLYVRKIVLVLLLFIIFKLIQRYVVEKLIRKIAIKSKITSNHEGFIKLLRFGVWAVFVVICITILVGDFTAMLASIGLIGFGLTFALQKPILNFVGWITIVTKRIYVEGDRIKVGNMVGDVVEIQVMNTILDGLLENSNITSGKKVILPNELVISGHVENFTMDSNYILEELSISITYESNYNEAMKILKHIIHEQISKNKSKYINKMLENQQSIDNFIREIMLTTKKMTVDKLKKDAELDKLHEEKKHLEEEIHSLEESFQPQIRVEMLDSSIQIIGQFKCPYTEIKAYRTNINLKFMDMINKRDDISIAYPHMQLVQSDKTKHQ